MHKHQFFTWTTHTAENTTLLDYKKLYTYMCNIVTEFYLYSIVYIYLINSRLDVTHSVRHHFHTIQTLSVWSIIITKMPFPFISIFYSKNQRTIQVFHNKNIINLRIQSSKILSSFACCNLNIY